MEQVLTQILQELQTLNLRMDKLDNRMDGLENQINNLEKRQTRLETRQEGEVIEKLRALCDARKVCSDNFNQIFHQLSDIENSLDYALLKLIKHDVKLMNVHKIS